jgi:hypothetical protein
MKEDRAGFGERPRVLEKDKVAHRTYEVVKAVVARFNQAS